MRIDREYYKPFDNVSATSYILSHPHALYEFLRKFKKDDALKVAMQFIQQEPAILATLLKKNFECTETLKIKEIIDAVSYEGTFTIMLGLPGGGKTATGAWVSEELLKQGIKITWFGYSPALAKAYPQIKQTFNLRSIDEGLLVYDELLLTLFGRSAMKKEQQERILNFPVARHHGYSVLCLSQSPRFDPLLKDLITYIWFKPFVVTGMFERKMRFRPFIRYLIPHQKEENMLYNMSNNECTMFKNPLPSRWSDEISKSMSPITDRDEAEKYAFLLKEAGISSRELITFLLQRNIKLEELYPDEDGGKSEKSMKELVNDIKCPHCKSFDTKYWGKYGNKQRFICNNCNKTWSASS